MLTGIQVIHDMTKNPIFIKKEKTVEFCAKEMTKNKVGSVLVIENKKLLGMVTEKDIMQKVISKGKDPKKVKMNEIMAKEITTVAPKEDIYYAILKMRNSSVRRLPVIDNGEIIGLLTLKDILRIQPDLFDIVVEKFRIREEGSKLGPLEANCEQCGNYSILYRKKDKLICEDCNNQNIY